MAEQWIPQFAPELDRHVEEPAGTGSHTENAADAEEQDEWMLLLCHLNSRLTEVATTQDDSIDWE